MAQYDAIVIGSGLGGLTAGALYATEGKRVLVLEQHSKFGGAATNFKRNGLKVEVGLHQQDGFGADDPKAWIFEKLGIPETLEFAPVKNMYTVRHTAVLGDDFVMPSGFNEALLAATQRFPRHKKALKRYFEILRDTRKKGCLFEKCRHDRLAMLLNFPIFPFRFWPMIRYEKTTVGKLLQDLFGGDEKVKFALCANLPYFSDDLNNFSLLFYVMGQGSLMINGSHYIKGGSQTLSNYLVTVIENAGGKALKGRLAEKIIVRGRKATGVVHSQVGNPNETNEDYAPVLFGNAAPQNIGMMLPHDLQERFLAQYKDRPLSNSLWSVYLGLNRKPSEFGVSDYTTFVFPPWMKTLADYKQCASILSGNPRYMMPTFAFVDYSRIDSRLGPESQYLGVICGIDDLQNWEGLNKEDYRSKKAAWLDCIVSALDREFPGIKSSVTYQEMATASTLKRFLKTPGGAVYGFAQQPQHAIRHRPKSTTSLDGLWLASSFTYPGGSFSGTMLAGASAYRSVMKNRKSEG